MSDQLLVVLRVCLLVLIYLVFLRVLRAVWVELKGGAATQAKVVGRVAEGARIPVVAAAGAASAMAPVTPSLVALQPSSLAGLAYPLDQETTIGRAAGCRISVEDTHVSKVHARVFMDQGRWFVEDLGSTNGTHVNETPVVNAVSIDLGDRVRIGETLLELR